MTRNITIDMQPETSYIHARPSIVSNLVSCYRKISQNRTRV